MLIRITKQVFFTLRVFLAGLIALLTGDFEIGKRYGKERSTMFNQNLRNLLVVATGCTMQRCPTVCIAGVDVGTGLEQK